MTHRRLFFIKTDVYHFLDCSVFDIQTKSQSSVYPFSASLCTCRPGPMKGDLYCCFFPLSVFSQRYVSFTPDELIAETTGVPFSGASQFSSPAFRLSVAFHATAISAHPGVMANSPQRQPRLRSLWIINIHSPQRGRRGGTPTRQHSRVFRLSPSQCQQSESSCARPHWHTHAHKLGTCMNDLPYLNTDCDKCKRKDRAVHTRAHTQTRTYHFTVVSVGGGAVWAPICAHSSISSELLPIHWHHRGQFKLQEQEIVSIVVFMYFHVKASCRINDTLQSLLL